MLARIFAVAANAYRESVRARILIGLFGLALATCAYAMFVAQLTLGQELRVVSDVGSASTSLYTVIAAIVIAASSLQRELELKTVYPILARPLRRHEYLIGKFLGTLLVLVVFVLIDTAAVLGILAWYGKQKPMLVLGAAGLLSAILGVLMIRAQRTRVFVLVPWALAAALAMWLLAAPAAGERQLVVASAVLVVCEAGIVAGVATLFSSFSSPFLTATFTFALFIVGRSADTLANLPKKQFGETLVAIARGLAHVVPNLHLYVPPRPLLLGHLPDVPTWPYVAQAAAHALFYVGVTLTLAAIVFRRRDFT
jgi:ABC-type transport system involved in multi-copper enzyme maturation permease subunit